MLAEAALVLGISLNTAYAVVKRGDLGVRVLRSELLALLGIDPPRRHEAGDGAA